VFDIIVLIFLGANFSALCRLQPFHLSEPGRNKFQTALIAGALFPTAMFLLLSVFWPKAFGLAVDYLGYSLAVGDTSIEVSYEPDQDQRLLFPVTIENRSSGRKRVVGYAIRGTGCLGAFRLEGLPLALGPFEKLELYVVFEAKKTDDPTYWTELSNALNNPDSMLGQQAVVHFDLIAENRQSQELTIDATVKLDATAIERYLAANK
jgi:hypothetical protein